MRYINLSITSALMVLMALPAFAQDLGKGIEAYRNGDYAEALAQWRPLAEAGHAPAQANLGHLYDKGHGVDQDYTKALKWYSRAAEQGDPGALFNLGHMYDTGQGVAQDFRRAFTLYRNAAKKGDPNAQFSLGGAYYFGKGVVQNYQIAHVWLNIASVTSARKDFAEIRDRSSLKLSPDALIRAQMIAEQCLESNYEYCP